MKKYLAVSISLMIVFSVTITFTASAQEAPLRELRPYKADEWLPSSSLGNERISSGWRYALREADGYAAILGYEGAPSSVLKVPASLDGHDVAAIESGALAATSAENITIPGNILRIEADAFGEAHPTVHVLSGSAALCYARTNRLSIRMNTSYDLVDGVIDFSDIPTRHITRKGDNHVWLSNLEGMRLSVGSVFWFKDARGLEYFYRVTDLTASDGGWVASVEVPDIADVIINYRADNTIVITAADIIPADNVTFSDVPSETKDRLTSDSNSELSFQLPAGKLTLNTVGSNNEVDPWDGKASLGVKANGTISKKIHYTYRFENGELVEATLEEDTKEKTTVSVSAGPKLSKELFDSEDYAKQFEERSEEDKLNLGTFFIAGSMIQIKGSLDFGYSASFGATVSFTSVEHLKKEYDFDKDDWVVVEKSKNARVSPSLFSLDSACEYGEVQFPVNFKLEGKVGLSLSISVVVAGVVKVMEVTGEAGVGISLTNKEQCIVVDIGPYAELKAYAGIWVSTKLGIFSLEYGNKYQLFSYKADDFLSSLHYTRHFYIGNKTMGLERAQRWNEESNCPFHSDNQATVTFDDRRGNTALEDVTVFLGEPLPWKDEYLLADDPVLGRFMGWSSRINNDVGDWSFDTGDGDAWPSTVVKSMTLYAVWENGVTVSFHNSPENLETLAESQHVPYGCSVALPNDIDFVLAWYTHDDNTGVNRLFNSDYTFHDDESSLRLYARMFMDDYQSMYNDPSQCFVIGDRLAPQDYDDKHFSYTLSDYDIHVEYNDIVDTVIAYIDNVKSDPEYLRVPGTVIVYVYRDQFGTLQKSLVLAYDDCQTPEQHQAIIDYITQNYEDYEQLKIPLVIKGDAFKNCTRLKAVSFVDREQLSLDTYLSGLTSLEFVDTQGCMLMDQAISNGAFEGCTALRAVRIRGYLRTVGDRAFYRCSSLGEDLVPPTVQTIGKDAYGFCNITHLELPESLETVAVSNDYIGKSNLSFAHGPFYGCFRVNRIDAYCTNVPAYSLHTGSRQVSQVVLHSTVESFDWRMIIGVDADYDSRFLELDDDGCPTGMEYDQPFDQPVTLTIERGKMRVLPGYNCSGKAFSYINLPDNLEGLENRSLTNMPNMVTFDLPQSLRWMEAAFTGNSSLQYLTIPSQVTEIPDYAFSGCTALEHLQLSPNTKSIGAHAFSNCTALPSLELPDGLLSIGTEAFSYCSNLHSINIPETVTQIATTKYPLTSSNYSKTIFIGCYNLKHLELYAPLDYDTYFFECIPGFQNFSLDMLVVGKNVKSIDLTSFCMNHYWNGTQIEYALKGLALYNHYDQFPYKMLHSLGRNLVYLRTPDCSQTILQDNVEAYPLLETLVIDDSTVGLRNSFCDCPNLCKVFLPDSVREISSSFNTCPNLSDIRFPENQEAVITSSFNGGAIENISLSNDVTIADSFCSQPLLRSLEIFNGVVTAPIAKNCPSLGSIHYGKKVIFRDSVNRMRSNFEMPLTDEDTSSWPDLSLVVESEESRKIPQNMFAYPNLRVAALSSSVRILGEGAFHGSTRLEKVTGLNNVETVKAGAFFGCTSLRSVDFSNSLAVISSQAFMNCSSLEEIPGLGGVKQLENRAFAGCTSLTHLTGLWDVSDIGLEAFRDCASLTGLDFSDKVNYIGEKAFMNCVSLQDFHFSTNLRSIGTKAFANCISLRHAAFPDSLSMLGAGAFFNCSSLKEIVLPHYRYGSIQMESNDYCWYFSPDASTYFRQDYDYSETECFNYNTSVERIVLNGPINSIKGVLVTNSRALSEIVFNTNVIENAADALFGGWTARDEATDMPLAQPLRIIVSSGQQAIGAQAFAGMDRFVSEIVLDDSVETIGELAFAGNTTLRVVRMGPQVSYIADNAFEGCGENVTVALSAENEYVAQWCAAHSIALFYQTAESYPLRLAGVKAWVETLPEGWMWDSEDAVVSLRWMEDIILPEPVWEGHVFSGWYHSSLGDWRFSANTMPRGGLTLYPRWDMGAYEIRLQLNGGTISGRTVFMAEPGKPLAIGETPVRDGFAFSGWYTDPACRQCFEAVLPEKDLTLYAGWKRIEGEMTFDIRGSEAVLTRYLVIPEDESTAVLPEVFGGMPVTGIIKGAFAGQTAERLVLPSSISNIENGALNELNGLKEIRVADNNPVYRSIDGVLFSANGQTLIYYPRQHSPYYHMPDETRTIAANAFRNAGIQGITLNENLLEIGDYAFANSALASLRLPDSVERIGSHAFYGSQLSAVFTGASLSTIGDDAFSHCSRLYSLYGNVGVCAASEYALQHSLLYNYYTVHLMRWMPEESDSNGWVEFKSIVVQAGQPLSLPDSPNVGEAFTFRNWCTDPDHSSDFTETIMPAHDLTLYTHCDRRFYFSLTGMDWYAPKDRKIVIHVWAEETGHVVIPETVFGYTVETIRSGCFSFAPESITIPSSVTSMPQSIVPTNVFPVIYTSGDPAYMARSYGWTVIDLNQIHALHFETNGGAQIPDIPFQSGDWITDSLFPEPERAGYTFAGWYTDESLENPLENEFCMSPDHDESGFYSDGSITVYAAWEKLSAFASLDFLFEISGDQITVSGLAAGKTSLTIPAEVEGLPVVSMAAGAFANERSLTSVNLENSVLTDLPDDVFRGCINLQSVSLPQGLLTIGNSAFQGCASLRNIALPDGLQTIGSEAFSVSGITALHLGSQLQFIEASAILDLPFLSEITVADGNPYYTADGAALIDLVDARLVRYAPAAAAQQYTIPDSVYAIGAYAFQNASRLQTITMNSHVWELAEGVFSGCTQLSSMPAPLSEQITIIPDSCFCNCQGIISVTIPETVQYIGADAFAGIYSLNHADIPPTVERIGMMAFTSPNLIIFGETGSAAHAWALNNDVQFSSSSQIILPEGLNLTGPSHTLTIGGSFRLSPVFTPENALSQQLIWSSGDAQVAVVTADGTVHGVAPGETVISAFTPDGLHAEWTVEVEAPLLTSILLAPSEVNLALGMERTLSCFFYPAIAAHPVTYVSSDESVAQISSDGLLQAVGLGDCVITAHAAGFTSQCSVHVDALLDLPDDGETSISMMAQESAILVLPEEARSWRYTIQMEPQGIVQAHPDSAVPGVLHLQSLAAGEATVSVILQNGQILRAGITVKPVMRGIDLDGILFSLYPLSTYSGTIRILPEGLDVLPQITYSSSDESIFTVEPKDNPLDGYVIHCDHPGTAELTVTAVVGSLPPFTQSMAVNVNMQWPSSMRITPIPECEVGDTYKVNIGFYPENALYAPLQWSVGDETVATVSEDGVITALSPGQTTLWAKASQNVYANAELTVVQSPTSIRFAQEQYQVQFGETFRLEVILDPANANRNNQYFFSFDPYDLVSYNDQTQEFTALNETGTLHVMASTPNGLRAECDVVIADPLNIIELQDIDRPIIYRQEGYLSGVLNAKSEEDRSITWSTQYGNFDILDVEIFGDNQDQIRIHYSGNSSSDKVTLTTASGYSRTYSLIVVDPAIPRITNGYAIFLNDDETEKLQISFSGGDDGKEYIITSSDESVFTVDDTGLITPVGPGYAEVIVTTSLGYTATCEVQVTSTTASQISLDFQQILMVGDQWNMYSCLITEPIGASITVEWSTEDSTVISIDENGLLTALSAGETVLHARYRGMDATCSIIVKEVSDDFDFTIWYPMRDLFLTEPLNKFQIRSATTAGTGFIIWSSYASDIVTIDRNGVLTAVSPGTATICASSPLSGGRFIRLQVVVREAPPKIMRLPAGVKIIEEEAFMGLNGVDVIVVPEGAESIGSRAFRDIPSLQALFLPDSLQDVTTDSLSGVLCEVFCHRDTAGYHALEDSDRLGQWGETDVMLHNTTVH